MSYPAQFHSLSPGQIVGQTLEAYRRLFRAILSIIGAVLLPGAVLIAGATAVWLPLLADLHQRTVNGRLEIIYQGHITSSSLATRGAVSVVMFLLGGMIWMVGLAAIAALVGQGYVGSKPQWRAAARLAWRRFGSLLWVAVLVAVCGLAVAVVGTLLAGLLGLVSSGLSALGGIAVLVGITYIIISLVVAMPVVLFSGLRGARSISESFRIVRGRWWATFGVLLLVSVGIGIVSSIVSAIFGAVGRSSSGVSVVGTLVSIAADTILCPLLALALTFIYFDLKNRRGELDLDSVAGQLAVDPASVHRPSPVPSAPGWGGPGGYSSPQGGFSGGWPPQPGGYPQGTWPAPQQPGGWPAPQGPPVPGWGTPPQPGAGAPPTWSPPATPGPAPQPPASQPSAPETPAPPPPWGSTAPEPPPPWSSGMPAPGQGVAESPGPTRQPWPAVSPKPSPPRPSRFSTEPPPTAPPPPDAVQIDRDGNGDGNLGEGDSDADPNTEPPA